MAATIAILKTTGQAGYETETEVTSPGLKSVDDAITPVEDAPVEIPSTGTNFSYETWLRFKLTTAPANQVTNFKIWSDGVDPATGVKITINTTQITTYATPVDTQSMQGTRDDFKLHDSSNKIAVDGTLVSVGDKTNFMVFQEEVSPSASPGQVSFNVNYQYDES